MPTEYPVITFVCTANVCRSPMAEKLLLHALTKEKHPLSSIRVISAGLSAFKGDPASLYSQKVLKTMGLSLSSHRSRQITKEIVEESHVIFCMTSAHRYLLEMNFQEVHTKIFLMREFLDRLVDKEIPDPYGLSFSDYESCRNRMWEAIPSIVAYLQKEIT